MVDITRIIRVFGVILSCIPETGHIGVAKTVRGTTSGQISRTEKK
jgi:hypothetical protein